MGSLVCFPAKALAKEISDIGSVVHDQDALMMLPLPSLPGEPVAVER